MKTPRDRGLAIQDIPDHAEALPPESSSPIEHFRRSMSDARNLLKYFERKTAASKHYPGPFEKHSKRLRAQVVLAFVGAFERFLKELAAVCINHVGPFILDDRLTVLTLPAHAAAAHFEEKDLGRALAEASTWLDSNSVNNRFRRLLADPFEDGKFFFFPGGKDPEAWRRVPMDVLWQLRHSIAHNLGVLTLSDAAKLRLLRKKAVAAPVTLALTDEDVLVIKLFLDEVAEDGNKRVAARLGELLTKLHSEDATLFNPATKASELATILRAPLTLAGNVHT